MENFEVNLKVYYLNENDIEVSVKEKVFIQNCVSITDVEATITDYVVNVLKVDDFTINSVKHSKINDVLLKERSEKDKSTNSYWKVCVKYPYEADSGKRKFKKENILVESANIDEAREFIKPMQEQTSPEAIVDKIELTKFTFVVVKS